MKATIDLPETLLREMKIRASRESSTVRAFVIRALEDALSGHPAIEVSRVGRLRLPLVTLSKGKRIKSLTNAGIDELVS